MPQIAYSNYDFTLRWILDKNETSLNTKCGTEGFSYFQNILAHDLAYCNFFFPASCPNETNTLNSVYATGPSDDFLHLMETSWDKWGEVEKFELFFVFSGFLFSGLGSRILELLNAPNTEKQM